MVEPIHIPGGDPWAKIKQRYAFEYLRVQCARHEHHVIRWYFLVRNMTIQKIGQHPSLADIAIDEMREKYRSVLRGENWSELYKAVGLACLWSKLCWVTGLTRWSRRPLLECI